MNYGNKKLIFSEPVNEIIGDPPRKIVRWGTSVILVVIVLFIFFAWLIRYPDIVPSPVEITTANPPVTLVARISGRIKNLYVKDQDHVRKGDLLAVMETAASIDQVRHMKLIADSITDPGSVSSAILPVFSQLGELQSYWGGFIKNLTDYNIFVANDFYGSKIEAVLKELKGLDEYIARARVKEKLHSENQLLEIKKFRRDSSLFANGVFSESDFEKSRQSLLRINMELQEVRLDQSAKVIEYAERSQLLQDYRIKREEERSGLLTLVNESFLNLKAQTSIWETNYLLYSPVDGTVTFTRYWSENQSVLQDEPVLSVVPADAGEYIGRISLKMQRSGKVEVGQKVNLKMSGYPYLEYGMVRGLVRSKSLVPSADAYIIEISLPEGLTTLYGRQIGFTQNMQGTAEIITRDLRLIEKIFNPFRHLASKSRQ